MARTITRLAIDKGYLPDLSAFELPVGGLVNAHNCIPYDDGYIPTKGLTQVGSGNTVSAVIGARYFDQFPAWFMGTSTKLYEVCSNNYVINDVTRAAGGDYNSGNSGWDFEQYGGWVIATDAVDAPQVFKTPAGLGKAVALGGSPPVAQYVVFFQGHLMFGNISEGIKTVQWSAYEDVETWTPSLTTGADSQNISDADGQITGFCILNNQLVISHERSLTVCSFIGAPYTYQFISNASRVGAFPKSMVRVNNVIYFLNETGVWMWDGLSPTNVSTGLNRWLSTVGIGSALPGAEIVWGASDLLNNNIYWLVSLNAASRTYPAMLIFNYVTKKFTWAEYTGANQLGCIFPTNNSGTLVPYSSTAWLPNIGACDTTNFYNNVLTGSNMTAQVTTGYVKVNESITQIYRIKPIIQGGSGTVTVSTSELLTETGTPTTASQVVGSNGWADLRASGLYHQISVSWSSGKLTSIELDLEERGTR